MKGTSGTRCGTEAFVLAAAILVGSADCAGAQEFEDLARVKLTATAGRPRAAIEAGGGPDSGAETSSETSAPTTPPLAYRFPVDDRFELVSTTHIDAPVIGAIDAVTH